MICICTCSIFHWSYAIRNVCLYTCAFNAHLTLSAFYIAAKTDIGISVVKPHMRHRNSPVHCTCSRHCCRNTFYCQCNVFADKQWPAVFTPAKLKVCIVLTYIHVIGTHLTKDMCNQLKLFWSKCFMHSKELKLLVVSPARLTYLVKVWQKNVLQNTQQSSNNMCILIQCY